ncbi:MAG: hypothetical protein ACAI43_27470 [Phycisphaerae bacterium]|nr:hypothetical protein [Tepidisphaeraceae bacterium]
MQDPLDSTGRAVRGIRSRVAWGALALGLASPAAAAPFLSVDFNTNASPNESPDFTAFAGGGNAANNVLPTKSYSTAAVASGSVTIRVASTPDVDANGDLNSSANIVAFNTRATPVDSGGFTYADLYRDFVYSNNSALSTYVQYDGLDALTSYAVTIYAVDPNSTKTTTLTDVTAGRTTALGSIVSPSTYTGNETYSVTATIESDSTGHITVRASSTTFATINGVRIEAVPEPTGLLLAALAAPLVMGRRRRAAVR